MKQLVVDTDVVSYIFRWHTSAPHYAALLEGNTNILCFATVAEMRFGALRASWGGRRKAVLEAYLSEFTYPDDRLCTYWAEVKNESNRMGHPMSAHDAWIAATALCLQAPLLTNNQKDYVHLKDLQMVKS